MTSVDQARDPIRRCGDYCVIYRAEHAELPCLPPKLPFVCVCVCATCTDVRSCLQLNHLQRTAAALLLLTVATDGGIDYGDTCIGLHG